MSLTTKEVSNYLNCSTRHVQSLIDRGDLPAYRIGSRLRVAREDVVDYLAAARVVPRQRSLRSTVAGRGYSMRAQLKEVAA